MVPISTIFSILNSCFLRPNGTEFRGQPVEQIIKKHSNLPGSQGGGWIIQEGQKAEWQNTLIFLFFFPEKLPKT